MANADTKIDKGHAIGSIARKVMCTHQEDYLEKLEVLANKGDAEAAYCIGYHFWQDRRQGDFIEWLRKGAQLGSRKAQRLISGELSSSHPDESWHWTKQAAMQGDDLSLLKISLVNYRRWLKKSDNKSLIYSYVFKELSGYPYLSYWGKKSGRKPICLKKELSSSQLDNANEAIKKLRSEIPNLPEKRKIRADLDDHPCNADSLKAD